MSDQADYWSKAAEIYEREFIDPYREAVRSPLHGVLARVKEPAEKTVADLGCGLGRCCRSWPSASAKLSRSILPKACWPGLVTAAPV